MTDEHRPDGEGPEEQGGENGGDEQSGRDWQQIATIALSAVLAIVVGVAIGWSFVGDTTVTSTTVPVAEPSPSTTAPPDVTTTTTTPGPPPTSAPGELTLTAVEDTYVDEGEPAEINGLEDLIEIEHDPPEIKRGLIRFDVAGVPEGETIRSAVLRLFVVDESDDAVTVHVAEGAWSQAETNDSNAPAVGDQVGTIPGPVPENQFVEVDVTSVVNQPGEYSFYLVPSGGDTVEIASLESGANTPTLVVRWLDDVTAGGGSVLDGTPVRMVGAGGIADCGDGASVTASLVEQSVQADSQTIVYTTGDNAFEAGSPDEYTDCYDSSWGTFKELTRPAPGDTAYETEGATGYYGYYGEAAGPAGSGYYSYEAGEWQVVVLNSNCNVVGGCEATSPQGQWLSSVLTDSEALCTLAYWHHPLFASSAEGAADDVEPLYTMLHENGAELVLTGTGGSYERFAPQGPDGVHDPIAGVRQFVVGTGGTALGDFGEVAANSEARHNGSLGVLALDLYSNGYEWEFAAEPGSDYVDLGSGDCH